MALPTGQRAIWDVTRRVNAAYIGNAIQVRNRAGATQDIGFVQVGGAPAADDPIDINALETFANSDGAWVLTIYDHSGNNHHLVLRDGSTEVLSTATYFRVCDNLGVALKDEFGNLIMRRDVSDVDDLNLSGNKQFMTQNGLGGITTNTMFGVWSINNTTGAIFGNGGRPYIGFYESAGTNDRIDRDTGATDFSLNWFKNGVQISVFNTNDLNSGGLYTEFNSGRNYYSITGGIFNQSPNTDPLTNARLFYSNFVTWNGDFQSYMIYPSDVSANRADVEDWYSTQLFTAAALPPSGTIYDTDGTTPINGAFIDIRSKVSTLTTGSYVETVTSSLSGSWTISTSSLYDNTLGYEGIVYHHKVAETGSVSSATTSSLFDTTKSWTADEFVSTPKQTYLIKIISGSDFVEERQISTNGTSSITPTVSFSSSINDTFDYEIVQYMRGFTDYYPPQS